MFVVRLGRAEKGGVRATPHSANHGHQSARIEDSWRSGLIQETVPCLPGTSLGRHGQWGGCQKRPCCDILRLQRGAWQLRGFGARHRNWLGRWDRCRACVCLPTVHLSTPSARNLLCIAHREPSARSPSSPCPQDGKP